MLSVCLLCGVCGVGQQLVLVLEFDWPKRPLTFHCVCSFWIYCQSTPISSETVIILQGGISIVYEFMQCDLYGNVCLKINK